MNSKEFFDNYWKQEGDEAITKLANKKYEDEDKQELGNDLYFLKKSIAEMRNKVNEVKDLSSNILDKLCTYVGVNILYKIIFGIALVYLLVKTKGL